MISVYDLMTRSVEVTTPDATLEAVAAKMRDSGVGMIPVLNRQKRMVGIISLDDLARLPGEQQRAGDVLEHVTQLPTT